MPFNGEVGKRRKRSLANEALDEKLKAKKAASAPGAAKPVANGAPPPVNVGSVGSA